MESIYIESSAVLAWLLGETRSKEVISILNNADTIVSSVLTVLEIERALIRAEAGKDIKPGDAQKLRGIFKKVSSGWFLMEITEEVRLRVLKTFPVEPIRTLDAIHLASVLEFTQLYNNLLTLSFDKRINENLEPLGLGTAI